jgi:hypothetical protein
MFETPSVHFTTVAARPDLFALSAARIQSTISQMSWDDILRAGVRAQQLIPGCVAVGGTAAALYARHRISMDTDHLLPNLSAKFDDALQTLEASPDWKTARTQRPVLILGSIVGVEVGYRQQRRPGTIGGIFSPKRAPIARWRSGLGRFRRPAMSRAHRSCSLNF